MKASDVMRGSGDQLPPFRCGDRVRVRPRALAGLPLLPGIITSFQLAPALPGGWRYNAKLDNGLLGIDLTAEDIEPETAHG